MVKGLPLAVIGIGAIAALYLFTRRAAASSRAIRVYVLTPGDTLLASDEVTALAERWRMALRWINSSVGRTLDADAPPIFLSVPESYGYIRNLAETGNVASYAYSSIAGQVGAPLETERYVVLLRGGGGFAGSIPSLRFAMLGDVTIESLLGHPENVIDIIFPELPRSEKWGYVTPDAQTGALIHEVLHLVLLAPDMQDSGIMGSWDLWPDAAVEPEVLELAAASPFFL